MMTSTSFVDINGSRIHVRETGRGRPLLMIHGFPFDHQTYDSLIERLAGEYRCITFDWPGLGQTEWTDATDFSVRGQANTLRDLIEKLGIRGCAAIAHDSGGGITRFVAAENPGLIDDLILLNTEIPGAKLPFMEGHLRVLRMPGAHMLWGLLLRMRIGLRRPEAFGWCFANPDNLTDAFIDRVIGPLADGHRRTGVMNYILNLDLGFIDQLREVHPKIEARVSFIWGAQDHWFPLADARGMVEQVRDCVGFTTVDDAALMVHEECPDAVAAAMRKHLEVQNPGANTSAKRAGLRTP